MSAAAAAGAANAIPSRPGTPHSPASLAPQAASIRAPQPSHAPVGPSSPADDTPGLADDSQDLMVLLAAFLVAPLVVVAALCVAASVNTWWAMALALCVYLAATLVIFATVAFVLTGNLPSSFRHHRAG